MAKRFRLFNLYFHYFNQCLTIRFRGFGKFIDLMLFWPPAFALISKDWSLDWNVWKNLWFNYWDRTK